MSDGPHRSASFVEHCAQCGARAEAGCIRCNRPWCEQHSSLDEELCADCDSKWLERKRRIESRWDASPTVEIAVGAILSVCGFVVPSMFGVPMRASFAIALFCLVLGVPVGEIASRMANNLLRRPLTMRLLNQRNRFLTEGPNGSLAELTSGPHLDPR